MLSSVWPSVNCTLRPATLKTFVYMLLRIYLRFDCLDGHDETIDAYYHHHLLSFRHRNFAQRHLVKSLGSGVKHNVKLHSQVVLDS